MPLLCVKWGVAKFVRFLPYRREFGVFWDLDLEFSGFWFLFSEIPKFDLGFIGILLELSGQTEFPEFSSKAKNLTIVAIYGKI